MVWLRIDACGYEGIRAEDGEAAIVGLEENDSILINWEGSGSELCSAG